MKTKITLLLVFLLSCAALANAGVIYENGSLNGNSQAWRFDGVQLVSDSFTVSGGASTINGLSIWVLIFMTDHNPSGELIISSQASGGGTVYFDQMVQFSSETECFANLWGYNNCVETANWTGGPSLPNGTYWVTLKNGHVPSNADFGWDENGGYGCQSPGCPSQAQLRMGTVPSESFTILGTADPSKETSPKTTSLLMFGAGFFGLIGIVRQRLS